MHSSCSVETSETSRGSTEQRFKELPLESIPNLKEKGAGRWGRGIISQQQTPIPSTPPAVIEVDGILQCIYL